MNNNHLSEAEIQQYALGKPSLQAQAHIAACAICAVEAANYRLIFSEMDKLPRPAFDFDVSGLVLGQLPQTETAPVSNERWFYLLIFAAFALIGVPVYIYRVYFLSMFTAILPGSVYLAILSALFILILQCTSMFRKYQKQMNALNYK
jgi:hypothetical protein